MEQPLRKPPAVKRDQPRRAKLNRVLHVINGEHYSGAERVQDLLALNLADYGYEVAFACVKPSLFPQLRQSTETDVYEVPMRGRFDLFAGGRLKEIARERGFQLLHAHTPRSLLIASLAARQLKCPLVYHVHSPVGRDSNRWLANWWNTLIERRALKHANRVICVSSSLKEYMVRMGLPAEKIQVVLNGVPENSLSTHLPLGEDPWVLGMVALFRPRKGLEVMLRSLQQLKNRNIPVRLLAVGAFESVEYQRQIDVLVSELGIGKLIEWTGFERDVVSRLRQMNLLVLPSLYGEGLPMVVLEAMSVGLPVVATRVEGMPEAIRNQTDGILVEPSDPISLAGGIQDLVSNREKWLSMQRSAHSRQREYLSAASMAAGVATVYDGLFDGTTRFG